MKQYLVFIILILSVNFVLADIIEDTNIKVKLHNGTIEIINEEYSGNNLNETFEIVNGSVIFKEFNFPIIFIKNETVDSSMVDKYISCIDLKGKCETEKAQFNAAWNNCIKDLNEYKLNNNKSIREKLNSCTLDKGRIQNDLTAANKQYADLEQEQKDKGNSTWIWFGGGIVLGILGYAFYQGKIGNQNKDESHKEFNTSQGV